MNYTDEFRQSSAGPKAIPLTTVNGTALSPASAAPSFFQLTSDGAEALKFYTDYNGSRYVCLTGINIKASANVTLEVKWWWDIGDGTPGEKFAYSMSLTGTQALNGVNTAYPFIEDIPPGTISYLEITTGGTATVSVNAMGRSHL